MNRKITIACLGQDLSGGGAERVQLELLKLLDRQSFSIELAYLRDCGDLHEFMPTDISPIYFSQGRHKFRSLVFRALQQYRAMAKRADLLFGMMDGLPIYLATILGALEKKPSIGWIHNTPSRLFLDSNHLHRILSSVLYPYTNQLVCVSEGVRQDLLNFCRFKRREPITIYNPMDIDSIRTLGSRPLPRTSQHWFDRPTIIGISRLVKQKRPDVLIRAFDEIVQRGMDVNLVILGEGPLKDSLQNLVAELKLCSRVFWGGFQSNPYSHIRAASVLVLSSEYEGLGMVLLEAMALGIPVISTDCPNGPKEILGGGQRGVLTPVGDHITMADAIIMMLTNQEKRSRYIQAGLKEVEHFRTNQITSQFEQTFKEVYRSRT